jgi:hypothetical protein
MHNSEMLGSDDKTQLVVDSKIPLHNSESTIVLAEGTISAP